MEFATDFTTPYAECTDRREPGRVGVGGFGYVGGFLALIVMSV